MNKYRVHIPCVTTVYYSIEVVAKDEEEAKKLGVNVLRTGLDESTEDNNMDDFINWDSLDDDIQYENATVYKTGAVD